MPRVLITAFEPYDRWEVNSSWLALVELTRNLPVEPKVTTRLYPVDFEQVRTRLASELQANYDFALHLGQAPGSSHIHLEALAVNVGGHSSQASDAFQPLVAEGPVAYRATLPLTQWGQKLREAKIPAQVSYHAGTYLCNAIFYLSRHFAQTQRLSTRAGFIHIPLAPEQALDQRQELASLPTATVAAGLRMILDEIARTGEA